MGTARLPKQYFPNKKKHGCSPWVFLVVVGETRLRFGFCENLLHDLSERGDVLNHNFLDDGEVDALVIVGNDVANEICTLTGQLAGPLLGLVKK